MMRRNFIEEYLREINRLVAETDVVDAALRTAAVMEAASSNGSKLIFAGNGASAAIASHAALDYSKQAKVRSVAFNDAAFITAFANDFGYENWLARALDLHMAEGDVLVLISSSGTSPNIEQAARFAKANSNAVISFTGFEADNPCAQLSDISFWLNSRSYNIIEGIHQIWLMMICDLIIGKTEYSVK